jgi:hypothetical protein
MLWYTLCTVSKLHCRMMAQLYLVYTHSGRSVYADGEVLILLLVLSINWSKVQTTILHLFGRLLMFSTLSINLTGWYDQQRNNVAGRVLIVNIPSSYIFTHNDTKNVIRLLATSIRDIDYWIKILISQA